MFERRENDWKKQKRKTKVMKDSMKERRNVGSCEEKR